MSHERVNTNHIELFFKTITPNKSENLNIDKILSNH